MNTNLSDLIVSWVRTAVPVLVGALVTWLIRQGVLADSSVAQPLTEVLVFVISAGYYFLVRLLEKVNPVFGFFLGVPAAPVYPAVPTSAVHQGAVQPQHAADGSREPGDRM